MPFLLFTTKIIILFLYEKIYYFVWGLTIFLKKYCIFSFSVLYFLKGVKVMQEIKIGKYRHFKGNEYEVLCVAKHSETQEEMVVYKALYGDGGVWVRPACMWNEKVERDGKIFQRFTYIGE